MERSYGTQIKYAFIKKEQAFLMVIDVVCGMEIDEKTAKAKSEYKGKIYYFCGPMCKLEFDDNPEKYVTAATK